MSYESLRIGIDLGGTKIEAIALDANGEVCARRRILTPNDDYSAILRAISALMHDIECETNRRATVGLCGPGSQSKSDGLIHGSNLLNLNGKPLSADLAASLQRPIRIENDANCFALSEACDGAAYGAAHVFGVILGTGVGGGVINRGEIMSGRHHIAGEWGHTPLPWMTPEEYPGRQCFCGHAGCIETFLSGPAFAWDFETRTGLRASPKEIVLLARNSDQRAVMTLQNYQSRLARALAMLINILDPDVIVLGGGMSNIEEIYMGLNEKVAAHIFTKRLETAIRRNHHGDASGVRGAAWLWPRQY